MRKIDASAAAKAENGMSRRAAKADAKTADAIRRRCAQVRELIEKNDIVVTTTMDFHEAFEWAKAGREWEAFTLHASGTGIVARMHVSLYRDSPSWLEGHFDGHEKTEEMLRIARGGRKLPEFLDSTEDEIERRMCLLIQELATRRLLSAAHKAGFAYWAYPRRIALNLGNLPSETRAKGLIMAAFAKMGARVD